ncbi:hypothetical protein AAY473_021223 [Plecturocebus cupreus]
MRARSWKQLTGSPRSRCPSSTRCARPLLEPWCPRSTEWWRIWGRGLEITSGTRVSNPQSCHRDAAASSWGTSAGGGPATLRPESRSSRARAAASRSAPGPPPG